MKLNHISSVKIYYAGEGGNVELAKYLKITFSKCSRTEISLRATMNMQLKYFDNYIFVSKNNNKMYSLSIHITAFSEYIEHV